MPTYYNPLGQARRWPLHEAARRGDAELCGRLVWSGSVAVDATDEDAHTALHWACDGGHVDTARTLLRLGAAVDVRNDDGATALHLACACEYTEVVEALLLAGADASARDEDGATPIECAPPAARDEYRRLAARGVGGSS